MKDQKLVNEYTYDVDSAGEPSVSGSTKYCKNIVSLQRAIFVLMFIVSFDKGPVEDM